MSGGKQSFTDVVGVNREGRKELFNTEQGASPGGMMGNEEMEVECHRGKNPLC